MRWVVSVPSYQRRKHSTDARTMALQIEQRDGTPERTVLTGMVLTRAVLGPIAARWRPDMFASKVGALVGGWCVRHYERYDRAPGTAIADYFAAWAESARDRESADSVARFLDGLSAESARLKATLTPAHVLDVAQVLFNRVRLLQHQESITADLQSGDVARALERVEAFRRVEVGTGAGIDVLTDDAAWDAMFNYRQTSLIDLPGGLRGFYEGALSRDAFVAWMAPFKRGKSLIIQDMAWRCVEQGVPTAYFECGDMSEPQVLARWAPRIAGRPLSAGPRGQLTLSIPVGIQKPDPPRGLAPLETTIEVYHNDVTPAEHKARRVEWADRVGGGTWKLSCHPAGTLTVAAAEAVLETWKRDGFNPGAVFFDYADLLAAPAGVKEFRDQSTENWKRLRGLSQKWHCLVGTVTQTNAKSPDKWVLDRGDFADDVRKFGQVTEFYGLNQTAAEKEVGIYRINCLMSRNRNLPADRCVYCAGDLLLGDPFRVSVW